MYVQCIFTYIYIYCVCKMYILVQNYYLPKIHIVRMHAQCLFIYNFYNWLCCLQIKYSYLNLPSGGQINKCSNK